jgi:hypothetical protein
MGGGGALKRAASFWDWLQFEDGREALEMCSECILLIQFLLISACVLVGSYPILQTLFHPFELGTAISSGNQ